MTTDTIITTALALINGPREWGRGIGQTLPNLAGLAVAKSYNGAPYDDSDYQKARHAVVQAMRTPA